MVADPKLIRNSWDNIYIYLYIIRWNEDKVFYILGIQFLLNLKGILNLCYRNNIILNSTYRIGKSPFEYNKS